MNTITLKSALKFWQEIVFIIAVGILVVWSVINVFWKDIYFHIYIVFLLLFICLIGQLFWKNKILGMILAMIFGLSSFYMVFAWLFDKETNEVPVIKTLAFCFFVGLTVTAVSMFFKHITGIVTDNDANNTTSQIET